MRFTQKLILWGSADILSHWNAFRLVGAVLADAQPEGSPEIMFAFEQVLYAIRRDLGHSNKGLGPGDLLRSFINDVDVILAARASEA